MTKGERVESGQTNKETKRVRNREKIEDRLRLRGGERDKKSDNREGRKI